MPHGSGLFWLGSSYGKSGFHGPLHCHKGEAYLRGLAFGFSCTPGSMLYARLSLGKLRSCPTWAALMKKGQENGLLGHGGAH